MWFIHFSQTTRLGKHINELRRRTTNESLAKRAKDLVKKWRVLILPEANGMIKTASISSNERSNSPDVSQLKSRKRPLKDKTEVNAKRAALNGQRDYEFSDNSNCSVKDLKKTDVIFINSDSNSSMPDQSNDSFTTKSQSNDNSTFEETIQQPKKRGRKKGSKNHKNLIVAAEESFSNKMSAISRNSKVKTTQELLADLQNRSAKPDIELRAAQLTESLSRIDQKLNPQKKINQNVIPIKNEKGVKNDVKISSNSIKSETDTIDKVKQENDGSLSRVSTPDVVIVPSDDEIVDVVGTEPSKSTVAPLVPQPLTIDGILSQLPPIDQGALDRSDEFPVCVCPGPVCEEVNNITVQIINQDQKEPYSIFENSPERANSPKSEDEHEQTCISKSVYKCDSECEMSAKEVSVVDSEEILNCATRLYMRDRYKLDCVSDEMVEGLKDTFIENVNGNYGLKTDTSVSALSENGLYVNIVPNFESLSRSEDLSCVPSESFNKYSISIDSGGDEQPGGVCDSEDPVRIKDSEFREWHQTLDVQSYNGESLRILPYVIID